MTHSRLNKSLLIVVAVLAVGLAFFCGLYLGYENRPAVQKVTDVFNKEVGQPANVDFAPFWAAWDVVNKNYVNGNSTSTASTTKKVTDQEKVWGAIGGMVAALGDPYTVFLPPTENKRFEEDIKGNFSGVGMEVGYKDGIPTVITPMPDSPAKAAGIKAGDKVAAIDDKPTSNMTLDQAIGMIRGPEGTVVKLTVLHEGDKKVTEIKVTRAVIKIPTIDSKTITDKKTGQKIFYIRLYNFSEPSADLFRSALRQFIDSGAGKLVLDLRGNPGGYLESAVDMASWFLPKDKVVVRESRISEGQKSEKEYRSAGYDIFNNNLKMMILVDQGSASAAEILAGALQEYKVAKLVGEKTFGKGSVQQLFPMTSGSAIKITIAKWLTPSGRSISKVGIEPDYVVPTPKELVTEDNDPQLNKAIQLLVK